MAEGDHRLVCPSCGSSNFEDTAIGAGQPGPAGSPASAPGQEEAPPPGAGPGGPVPSGSPLPAERWLHVLFVFDRQTWRLEVPPGGETELGRDPGYSRYAADLAADDSVSRRHAVIGVDEKSHAWIRDTGSSNGTFVNDRRVELDSDHPLRNGDRLRLGLDTLGKVRLASGPQAAGCG